MPGTLFFLTHLHALFSHVSLFFSCMLEVSYGLGLLRFATTTAPATTTSGTRHHYWTDYLAYVPALDAISHWPSLAGQRSLDDFGSRLVAITVSRAFSTLYSKKEEDGGWDSSCATLKSIPARGCMRDSQELNS